MLYSGHFRHFSACLISDLWHCESG